MMNNFFFLLVIGSILKLGVLSPLPKGEEVKQEQEITDDVKDLESLRAEIQANVSENDHPSGNAEPLPTPLPSKEEVPPTKSRSAIFRHRGITQAKKSQQWSMQPSNGAGYGKPSEAGYGKSSEAGYGKSSEAGYGKSSEAGYGKSSEAGYGKPSEAGYGKFPGIQYSPTDLAAYVFNTGDEEGVAVAVEELVREGMMGRTDAINYLQDVKQILNYLKEQYEHERRVQEYRNRIYPKPQLLQQRFPNPPREQYISDMSPDKRESKTMENQASQSVMTTEHPHQEVIASTSEPPSVPSSTTARPITEPPEHKEDVKRRPMNNDFNSFTMQVIYKLAKDMFAQSIVRDDPAAEETLTRLIQFLESEVRNQRISSAMKEHVLEVISTALVDSLRDYHGYVPENQPTIYDEGGVYQHLPDPIGPKPMSDQYRDMGHGNLLHLASKLNRESTS